MSMLIMPSRFGSQPLWTPADLSTPPVMWESNTSTIVTDSNGRCNQWNDLSGNGNSIVQNVVADNPTINASGQNGLRTLGFVNTTPQYLVGSTAARSVCKNLAGLTIYVFGSPTKNAGTIQHVFDFSVSSSGSARAGIYLQSNNVLAFQRRADTDTAVSASQTQPDSSWHLYESQHNWTGATVALGIDGGALTSASTGQGSGNCANTNSSEIGLMGSPSTPGQFASGSIGEIIVLNYIPTTTEDQKIQGYGMWKWGTQANLPSSHPYKSAAPTT